MSKKWYNYFVTIENESIESNQADMPLTEKKVSDIMPEIPGPETFVTKKIELTSENIEDFSKIYEAVGIAQPVVGFDIYKVEEMLNSPHLKDMPSSVKKNAVMVALEASKVPVEEIIKDAVSRDRALDAYEKVEQNAVELLEKQKADENTAIQEEIDRFLQEKRSQIEENNISVRDAKERFKAWQLKKQDEEQRIYNIVSYFVSPNPITTTTNKQDSANSGTPDVNSTLSSQPPKPE